MTDLFRMPSEEELNMLAMTIIEENESHLGMVAPTKDAIHRLLESRRVVVDIDEIITKLATDGLREHGSKTYFRIAEVRAIITTALGVKEKTKNIDEPVDVIDLLDQIDCLKAELEAVKEKEPVDVEALAEKCMGVLIINSGRDYCDSIERECMRNEFSAAIRVALKEGAGEAMRPLGQKTNPEGSRSASEEGEGGAGVRKEK